MQKARVSLLIQNPAYTAFEPTFIFRFGGDKLNCQLALTTSTGKSFDFFADNSETMLASIGLSLSLKNKGK